MDGAETCIYDVSFFLFLDGEVAFDDSDDGVVVFNGAGEGEGVVFSEIGGVIKADVEDSPFLAFLDGGFDMETSFK